MTDELKRCLMALRLEVPPAVADDVKRIVTEALASVRREAREEEAAVVCVAFGCAKGGHAKACQKVAYARALREETPAEPEPGDPPLCGARLGARRCDLHLKHMGMHLSTQIAWDGEPPPAAAPRAEPRDEDRIHAEGQADLAAAGKLVSSSGGRSEGLDHLLDAAPARAEEPPERCDCGCGDHAPCHGEGCERCGFTGKVAKP